MKKLSAISLILLATAAFGGDPCPFTDQERARWTHADMMSWKIALSAYKQDNGKYS